MNVCFDLYKTKLNYYFPQELSPAEVLERERLVRRLREELRNEEMKLVLLKKLRQSQQMKENIAVVPPTTAVPAMQASPTPQQSKPVNAAPPPPPAMRNSHSKPSSNAVPHLLRGVSTSFISDSVELIIILTPEWSAVKSLGADCTLRLSQLSHPSVRSVRRRACLWENVVDCY